MTKTRTATELLLEQHHQLREMFRQIAHAAPTECEELFDCIRATIAVHETAEQLILHPMARTIGPDGERVVEHLLEEERSAATALADLEDSGTRDPRFQAGIAALERSVLHHAEEEERTLFPMFEGHFDLDVQERAARRIELAERLAPTHPHPHAPDNPVGLALSGPFLSMVDRVRDALSG